MYRWLDMYVLRMIFGFEEVAIKPGRRAAVPSIYFAAKQNRSHAVRSRYCIRFIVVPVSASAPLIRSGLISLLEEVRESFSHLNCVLYIVQETMIV